MPPFVFAVLLISSFIVLRDYFLCFTQFGAVPTVRILIKFFGSTPLEELGHEICQNSNNGNHH